ncbi:hypothetical protein PV08_10117 [Exophiala spinifera]|uniref:BZIP domain-containing protein n=1 Tax=Exophiala spinifera TaxID=91928 RepID=A0A0D2AVQ2_9EURO|nr:uncharacterized protein PV08_10117 [Exophiala spinifera]KIW10818.1 hypothetical protein PV08_10117 [Exophiala spinifera]
MLSTTQQGPGAADLTSDPYQGIPMTDYHDWSFVPSSMYQDNDPNQVVDFFLDSLHEESAQAEHIRRASSVIESDSSDIGSLRHHQLSGSYMLPRDLPSPAPSSSYGRLDLRSAEDTPLRGVLVPVVLSDKERRHRRREQNRKAQHAFREKRKAEARRVENELAELKSQLAKIRYDAATSGWTICVKCRNFFPPGVNASTDADAEPKTPPYVDSLFRSSGPSGRDDCHRSG